MRDWTLNDDNEDEDNNNKGNGRHRPVKKDNESI